VRDEKFIPSRVEGSLSTRAKKEITPIRW